MASCQDHLRPYFYRPGIFWGFADPSSSSHLRDVDNLCWYFQNNFNVIPQASSNLFQKFWCSIFSPGHKLWISLSWRWTGEKSCHFGRKSRMFLWMILIGMSEFACPSSFLWFAWYRSFAFWVSVYGSHWWNFPSLTAPRIYNFKFNFSWAHLIYYREFGGQSSPIGKL